MRRFLVLLAALATAACSQPEPAASGPGGPFQMVDQNGRAATESLLKDRWTVVFFGFTYCPDACPTMLQALKAAEAELGRKAKDIQVVFVSVDPERDTPESLKAYVADDAFPEGTIGLTGTPEQVAAMAKAYRVYFKRRGEGEDYLVDHTTAAFLMNPKGEFVRVLAAGMTPTEMAAQIRDAMRG
jgi:protein SCO1/2